jgi:Ca2+-binding EF-hand superfamily protein
MFEFACEATTNEFESVDLEQSVEEDSLIPQMLTQSQHRRRLIAASTRSENHCVSLSGIEVMISRFFGGIGEYSHADLANLFKEIDIDNSGLIDEDEFENFINLAMGSDEQNYTIKKIGDNSTLSYLEGMASNIESPLDDWSMFYCGNSDPIVKTLKGIEGKYHIRLGIEKFDW